jgi:catechol 2,3-dioxygenase-like lactoylglutathione lyase family enzyme
MGSISFRDRQSHAHEVPYDRYGIGLHHLAFGAPSREVVDERAEWLRSQGAEIESGPEEYGYTPGYYAVFFADPDGMKLEVVFEPAQGAERDVCPACGVLIPKESEGCTSCGLSFEPATG